MENQISRSTPRDVFLHLLSMVTLYLSVISFITLLFQYINIAWPDQLNYYYQTIYDSIRWTISTLIIAFPLYLFLSWLYNKEVNTSPERRDIGIRKSLVYLTLLISAVAIITQLIRLIYNFLGGELTLAFSLKLLTVLAVAGAVFIYYLWDLRRNLETTIQKVKIIAWSTGLIVLIAIISGFFVAGSPQHQRLVRLDEKRVANLQNIQSEIVSYWQKKNVLPLTLAELQSDITGFSAPQDPATQQAYEYTVKNQLAFELCANFATDNTQQKITNEIYGQNWQHTAGRVCFSRTIDPQRDSLPTEKTVPATPVK